MSVASVFDFRFDSAHTKEGFDLASQIGADMPATEGYIDHEVIRDFTDAGHVVVLTRWHEQSQGENVLKDYIKDAKVQKATELAGAAPGGFLGAVV